MQLIPPISQLFEHSKIPKHQLHAIILPQPPPSYTPLPIPLTLAKTLPYPLHLKLYPLSSLNPFPPTIHHTHKLFLPLFHPRPQPLYTPIFHSQN
ncbi:hypothetical protein, partial [Staphylococcus aureus]|uniref:hypothetical protein n=1 Tax=Staphylococcus aureus TaxID=1280 RepID=UPI0037D9DBC7